MVKNNYLHTMPHWTVKYLKNYINVYKKVRIPTIFVLIIVLSEVIKHSKWSVRKREKKGYYFPTPKKSLTGKQKRIRE